MPTRDIKLDQLHVASVDRLRATITKDGTAWSGIDSVELTFEKPDRSTQFSRDMVAEDASAGIWYYDTTITDIDETGWWTLSVKVTDGSIIKTYPYEIGFAVVDEP